MKVLFWGTSEFALPFLETLSSNRRIDTVITTPDKPAGRGLRLTPPPVKREALALGLNVLQPENLREKWFIDFLRERFEEGTRVSVLVSYGKKIPPEIIEIFTPPEGYFLGIHPSLLPKYRGASPIQRAIMNGEKETGITIFQITEELDAGNIIAQEKVIIEETTTAGELERELSRKGVVLLENILRKIETGETIEMKEQVGTPSYAPKIRKEELWIDWKGSSADIFRKINALSPRPGARSYIKFSETKKLVKLLRAKDASKEFPASSYTSGYTPGTPLKEALTRRRLVITCGNGTVEILELQIEGKRKTTAGEFLNGIREEFTLVSS